MVWCLLLTDIYARFLVLKIRKSKILANRTELLSGMAVPVVPLNFKIAGFLENDTPFK